MSNLFIFVLAMFVGDNPVMGTDVVFLRSFDSNADCVKFIKQDDLSPEVKKQLACLILVKPDTYRERDET